MTPAEQNSKDWWPPNLPEIKTVLQQMSRDGSWGRYQGPFCDQLIARLQAFHRLNHVTLCSSGTVGIELALRAIPIRPGDEIIISAYDFKALFATIVLLEATPVLIDCEQQRPVPDLNQLRQAIGPKTRAVMVSHLHGFQAGITSIRSLCDKKDMILIEDACQFHGSTIDGKPAGSIGHLGILSFGGSKLMTAGRGGVVMTDDRQLAQRIQLYTQRGNSAYPLSELQAAVLIPQLERLPEFHDQRKEGLQFLLRQLTSPVRDCFLIPQSQNAVFYKVAVLCPDTLDREEVSAKATAAGVALFPAFAGLHRIHSARRFRTLGPLPNADQFHDRLMVLHHPLLIQSNDVLTHAAQTLNSILTVN